MNNDQIIKSEINLADENTALKAELEALKASIEDEKQRILQEKEFFELFPQVSLDEIPRDVYEYVKTHGSTLAAAYAVYHRRAHLEKEKAEKRALENTLKTPGSLGASDAGASERLFTSEEIRSMDREQVKKNYKQIMKSLRYGK